MLACSCRLPPSKRRASVRPDMPRIFPHMSSEVRAREEQNERESDRACCRCARGLLFTDIDRAATAEGLFTLAFSVLDCDRVVHFLGMNFGRPFVTPDTSKGKNIVI